MGLNSERKKLIEYLQRCGVVDISDSREGILESRETAASISKFESYMSAASEALDILSEKDGIKTGFFSKPKAIKSDSYTATEGEIAAVMGKVTQIIRTKKEIDKCRDKIADITAAQNALSVYVNLDVPPAVKGTRTTLTRLGTVEGGYGEEQIWAQLREAGIEDVYFEIINESQTQTALWFLYPSEKSAEFEAFFAKINFLPAQITMQNMVPKNAIEEMERKREELNSEISGLDKKLLEYTGQREDIELFYDRISVRRDKYKALEKIGITDTAFFVTGYLPDNAAEALGRNLEKHFTVSWQVLTPEPEEDVPSAFVNNGFVSPVENITADYSMPSAKDIDPNPVMAIFYYFFFGMMFSDAGYGILMMIGCGLLGFGEFIEQSRRKMFKMFFFCGVSTTIWGLLYGSFFGDMIATVSKTFGSGRLALEPILLDPVQKPLELLIMSVVFGMIHILTALAIKFYMTWRDGDRLGAVFDTGFWFVLLFGAMVLAAGAGLGIGVLTTIGAVMMAVCAAGLILTQGRDKKNPIMKLFGGILSLYDITSYVGDALSYSRLMALGLATGVIASVVNVLGSLGGNSVVGFISFVLISAFGHLLNFAINMLGAYVHTNRLQYVEFYQKFYEGGGRKYKPLRYDTKYYEFKN